MKKLLYLILLLPLWVNAQTNGTIQKTSATSVIRGNFGSLGADTLVAVRGTSVNGQLLQYNSTYKKWVPYTIPIDGATGIISGGTITGLGGANAIVAAGTGTILDNTTPSSPALYNLSWVTDTIGLTDNATNYLYYDSLGVLNATTTIPNPANFRTRVYLGRAQKTSGAITSINGAYVPIQQTPANLKDMFTAYGLTKTGLVVSPASTNLTIAVASGGIFSFGANFQSSVLNPNNLSYTANSPQTFRMVTAGDISVTNITVLPVGSYNPSGTTVSAIGGGANESSIFTVYKFPTTGNVRVLYGQTTYSSLALATQAIGSYVPNPPAVFSDAIIIGYIAAVKTATDLSNTAQAVFVTTNKFGGVGGGFASTALTNYMQTDFSNKTAAVPISTTTISNGGTANGISYASDVIRLHKVTATTGGVLTSGTDTIAGNKTLNGNLTIKQASDTAIVDLQGNVTNGRAISRYSLNTTTKWDVGLRQGGNFKIFNHRTNSSPFEIDGGSNLIIYKDLSSGTAGTDSIVVHNDTDNSIRRISPTYYLTPTGSGSGLSGVVLLTGAQSIAGAKTLTDALVGTSATFSAGSTTLADNILTVQGGGGSGAFGFAVKANNGDNILSTNNVTYGTTFGGAITGTIATFSSTVTGSTIEANGILPANRISTAVMDFQGGNARIFGFGASGVSAGIKMYTGVGGTGSTERYAMDASGNNTWTGSGSFGGQVTLTNGAVSLGLIRLRGYTVATLPVGTSGDTAYVTDANATTYNSIVAGGGANVMKVFYNGTNWVIQ